MQNTQINIPPIQNSTLSGKLVRLREYRIEDAKLAQAFMNDMEVRGYLHPGIPYPYTLEEETEWVKSQNAKSNTHNFAIETLEDARYIGGCGINNLDWKNRVATVGIYIGDKTCWGSGYGTDAMRLLLRFIFMEMNIQKVALLAYAFNYRAIRCYEKCGFVEEGRLRRTIFRGGKYHDEVMMGILFEEWQKIEGIQ